MGWLWKSLHNPPKVDLDWAALSLLPLSCMLITATNQSLSLCIPPACPFSTGRTGNGVVSAVQSPGAGWNWWVSAVVVQRLGGRYWFSKENPNVVCSSWQKEGHPTAWCHPAGKHSWRAMVGNSLRKGKVKCLCPAASPPQQLVQG